MSERKTFDDNFKAKIVLEAIKGDQTLVELASHYEIQPTQIRQRKHHFLEHAGSIFYRKKDPKIKEQNHLIEVLYKKIIVVLTGKATTYIIPGKIGKTNLNEVLKAMDDYWYLTKDKIDKCKDSELRYICFDCREVAHRASGNLTATNPNCKYNPYTGNWSNE